MSPQVVLQPIEGAFPGVFLVPGQNEGRYPAAHGLAVEVTPGPARPGSAKRALLLVDTGAGHRTIRRLCRTHVVTRVLLSHWHEDHVSGNALLQRKHAPEFWIHADDAPVIRALRARLHDLYGTTNSPALAMFEPLVAALDLVDLPGVSTFTDGHAFALPDGRTLVALHTPGHSAGHACFHEPKSRFAFLADVDLSGLGPWYGARDGDVDAFERAIQRLLALDLDVVVSAHKGVVRGRAEIRAALERYLGVIPARDARVLELLDERTPTPLDALVGQHVVYKRYGAMKAYLHIAERCMIAQHLARLARQGRVTETPTGYCLTGAG